MPLPVNQHVSSIASQADLANQPCCSKSAENAEIAPQMRMDATEWMRNDREVLKSMKTMTGRRRMKTWWTVLEETLKIIEESIRNKNDAIVEEARCRAEFWIANLADLLEETRWNEILVSSLSKMAEFFDKDVKKAKMYSTTMTRLSTSQIKHIFDPLKENAEILKELVLKVAERPISTENEDEELQCDDESQRTLKYLKSRGISSEMKLEKCLDTATKAVEEVSLFANQNYELQKQNASLQRKFDRLSEFYRELRDEKKKIELEKQNLERKLAQMQRNSSMSNCEWFSNQYFQSKKHITKELLEEMELKKGEMNLAGKSIDDVWKDSTDVDRRQYGEILFENESKLRNDENWHRREFGKQKMFECETDVAPKEEMLPITKENRRDLSGNLKDDSKNRSKSSTCSLSQILMKNMLPEPPTIDGNQKSNISECFDLFSAKYCDTGLSDRQLISIFSSKCVKGRATSISKTIPDIENLKFEEFITELEKRLNMSTADKKMQATETWDKLKIGKYQKLTDYCVEIDEKANEAFDVSAIQLDRLKSMKLMQAVKSDPNLMIILTMEKDQNEEGHQYEKMKRMLINYEHHTEGNGQNELGRVHNYDEISENGCNWQDEYGDGSSRSLSTRSSIRSWKSSENGSGSWRSQRSRNSWMRYEKRPSGSNAIELGSCCDDDEWPHYRPMCQKCGQEGHFAPNCQNFAVVNAVEAKLDTVDDQLGNNSSLLKTRKEVKSSCEVTCAVGPVQVAAYRRRNQTSRCWKSRKKKYWSREKRIIEEPIIRERKNLEILNRRK